MIEAALLFNESNGKVNRKDNNVSCPRAQFLLLSLVFSFLVHLQILLTSDVLFAFLRREYDLHHGIYPPVLASETASVILQ